MKNWLKSKYKKMTLAARIRNSFLLLIIPVTILLFLSFFNSWAGNRRYEEIVDSIAAASGFNLDFKKEYDDQMYLVIAGDRTPEESDLEQLLGMAEKVIDDLAGQEQPQVNRERLERVGNYLLNLRTYQEKIKANLLIGNRYEENIEIWEKDVQIVTSLIQEEVYEYIFYEARDLQDARVRYRRFYLTMFRITLIFTLIICVWVVYLIRHIPGEISQPIRELGNVTDQVAKGNLSVRSHVEGSIEAVMLSDSLNSMIEQTNVLITQIKNEQESLRRAEFQLLQAQIKPHFLYNTLDTIVWLAEAGDQSRVIYLVKSLSNYFRTSLSQGKDIVTLKEELAHVSSYLEIQHVRYQDILKYDIAVPEALYPYLIPKISIQPLVENALYHGIKNRRGVGTIRITGEEEGGDYRIVIEDNGNGMSPEKLADVIAKMNHSQDEKSDVYGLYNVNERIRLHFGNDYGLEIKSEAGSGTAVTMKLPCSHFPKNI